MRPDRIINLLYTVFFIVAISLSTLELIFGVTTNSDNTEWRNLAKFPQLNSKISIYEFPEKFEEYFNDNFGFRNWILNKYEEIRINIFHTSPSRLDILGKQNWAFYNPFSFDPNNPNYKAIYEHVEFSGSQLEFMKKRFKEDRDWLKQRNISYLLVIVPDKEVIYPEYYPYPNNIITNIGLNQFLNYLQKDEDLNVLYLKDTLQEAKTIYGIPLYYHWDTHWNQLGTFKGYQAIMKKFKEDHPEVKLLMDSDFEIEKNILPKGAGDLFRLMQSSEKQGEIEVNFRIKENTSEKLTKFNSVYVYGDSYSENYVAVGKSEGLVNFLKYNFTKIHMDNDPEFILSNDYANIERDKPVLVIREIIQRNIRGWGP